MVADSFRSNYWVPYNYNNYSYSTWPEHVKDYNFQPYIDSVEKTSLDFIDSTDIYSDEKYIKAYYEVNINELSIIAWKEDVNYEKIWRIFSSIIPFIFREDLYHFIIIDNPNSGEMWYIGQNNINNKKWDIVINISEFRVNDNSNKEAQIYMLLHEFSRLLTLNKNQVSYTPIWLDNMDIKKWFMDNCENIFVTEGCSYKNSYINEFVSKFWNDNDLESVKNNSSIYNEDKFVTLYASKDPAEDIAESFVHFILLDYKPTSKLPKYEKVKFFYNYDNLLELRKYIRKNLENLNVSTL